MLPFTVTVQLVPFEESQPLQLPKVELPVGEAVRVTWVPELTDSVQVPGQLMLPPVTVPVPLPAVETFSVSPPPPPPPLLQLAKRSATPNPTTALQLRKEYLFDWFRYRERLGVAFDMVASPDHC